MAKGSSGIAAAISLLAIAGIVIGVSHINIEETKTSSSNTSSIISNTSSEGASLEASSNTSLNILDRFQFEDVRTDFINLDNNKGSIAHFINFNKDLDIGNVRFEISVDGEESKTYKLTSSDVVLDYENDCRTSKIMVNSLPFDKIINTRYIFEINKNTVYTNIKSGSITSTSDKLNFDNNTSGKTIKKLNYGETNSYYYKADFYYDNNYNYVVGYAAAKSNITSVRFNQDELCEFKLCELDNDEFIINRLPIWGKVTREWWLKYSLSDLDITFNENEYNIYGYIMRFKEEEINDLEFTFDFYSNEELIYTSESFIVDNSTFLNESEHYVLSSGI